MSLRWRLALVSGVAAAISVVTVMVVAYFVACDQFESTYGPTVLEQVAELQDTLGWPFVAVTVGGLVLAALLGWFTAHTALRPVSELTTAAHRIADTRDLAHRMDVSRGDELGSLAESFNTMLDALERSAIAQRRLVTDASHELRTPLTAVRTNVELLLRSEHLSVQDREELSTAAIGGLAELTTLLSDLMELTRDGEPEILAEEVRLDALVREQVDRVSARWPLMSFETSLTPTTVRGVSDRLSRALANILDNAAKYSPHAANVEVCLNRGVLTVRDHGSGIPPGDLPYVFERFYRAAAARPKPGSGLGLAIVKQIVESHGGTVSAAAAPGEGTIIRLALPVS
ncbi:HAMP domain-containing sensor histidine kinase [Nonomuraea endophytica]|uniref:HAMP domain-containing sensor histidine kinase n=1 Tax=Nonomuraea endophytica TaxID=714136 RepID=UPI0037C8EE2A